MTDSEATNPFAENAGDEDSSFFEMATSDLEDESGSSDRVQELKRMLFDLSYLVMNADGTEHISEKMLVQKLERRMEQEGSVDVEARADDLASLLEEGPDAIRERVLSLAEDVADRADDRLQELGDGYLEFLKGLIVADADVDEEEYDLFNQLCERWGVEKELPRS
jgi:hypothetical protein